MVTITPAGLDRAIANTKERQRRLADMSAVNRAFAAELRKEVARAFQQSKSPRGEKFPPLKASTIKGRKKRKASLRSGGGLETALANSLSIARAGVKPLIDTGRLKKSIGIIARPDGLKVFYVGYLRPHIGGGGANKQRPPKRNPLPVEKTGSTKSLIPRLAQDYKRRIRAWVMSGVA